MKRIHKAMLVGVVLAALLAGCTSSQTIREEPPDNQTDSGEIRARGSPGFEGAIALAAVGGAALALVALRRR